VGSAMAHRPFGAGHAVVLHDGPRPRDNLAADGIRRRGRRRAGRARGGADRPGQRPGGGALGHRGRYRRASGPSRV
ncbi:MAG: hypothetical protein AVDCRST_MAG59-4080, partial [uncultured Thermomicrobiales bacterium]